LVFSVFFKIRRFCGVSISHTGIDSAVSGKHYVRHDARNFKGRDEPLFASGPSKWTLRVPRLTDGHLERSNRTNQPKSSESPTINQSSPW
jgi:hypothetical protein